MAPSTESIVVAPVAGRTAVGQFLDLPRRLYRGDPHWISPLDLEQKTRLFGANPFFQHADVQAWVALRDGVPVGRITAQIDHLYAQTHGRELGYFGMFEAEDDDTIVAALLDTAEQWLRQRGIREIQGPFNLSINEEVGLLVDGFDRPPFIMMGHALPHYGPALERRGYHKAKDLLTYTMDPDFITPRVMARLVEKQGRGVKVRQLDRRRSAAEFATLRDIFNDAWSDNWGFVPFTEAEFSDLAKTLAVLIQDDYVQIAEIDGQPAAFIVALPNVNEAARDLNGKLLPLGWAKLLWRLKVRHPLSARVPLMGVRKQYQHTLLGPALAFMVIDAVRGSLVRKGVKTVEMGWILENNAGMRNIIETIGGKEYKKYRVYQKNL